MNAAVLLLAEAATKPAEVEGRWSVQPSLAVFALVVVLLVGFYLGRASDGIHSAWLSFWEWLGFWVKIGLCVVGGCWLLWWLGSWWISHKGAG